MYFIYLYLLFIHYFIIIVFHYSPWCFLFGLLRAEARNSMHDSQIPATSAQSSLALLVANW